jgi:hypothetical protein
MNHHHKTSHMRFGFDLPMDMNPNHRNSDYWVARRTAAMKIILANPDMEAIWDSEIVPMIATVMIHALLAEKIVSGEITQTDAGIEAHTSAAYGQLDLLNDPRTPEQIEMDTLVADWQATYRSLG